MCNIASAAVGPGHLYRVRLKAGRHHVNDRPSSTVAARFLRVMIHSKTANRIIVPMMKAMRMRSLLYFNGMIKFHKLTCDQVHV